MKKIQLLDSFKDLKRLMIQKNSIRTSDGSFYGGKNDVWARDRAITGDDLINIKPKITKKAILDLARFQGTTSNNSSGEEPGRIHTEHREIYNNDKIKPITQFGLSLISYFIWKTGWDKYTTYFSSDTTPLFIRTTYNYSKIHPSILRKKIKKIDNSVDTILESVIKAAKYIETTIDNDGLIRIKEHNPTGNQFRYWRDSPNSYRDEFSKLPNISEEMVILDVQYLSIEALCDAANLINHFDHKQAVEWYALADQIRIATIRNLWMDDQQYFSYGMDEGDGGSDHLRQIKTIQSNAGWLLSSNFFEEIPSGDKEKYITGIITRLFSDEFLTDAGIRCRSKKYMNDRNFHSYHGSWVSWPVDSYMFSKGLRQQGFGRLADQIDARILNTVNMAGVNYEFFIIDENSKVLLNPNKPHSIIDKPLPLEMKPEKTIAWTVTATLRAKKERTKRQKAERKFNYKKPEQPIWALNLENDILAKIKNMPFYETRQQIKDNRYPEPNLYIDQKAGLSRAFIDLIRDLNRKYINKKIKNIFHKNK